MRYTASVIAAPTPRGRALRSRFWPRRSVTFPAALALGILQAVSTYAQPPVLQRGYDAGVSGAALGETILTTSNVNSTSFGLVFKLPVDDAIFAQPLFVPYVVINGRSHNVVYVATMSDTLYAFDADIGGAPLWTINLATFENAMPVPVAQFAYSGDRAIVGNLGILSTPVIDPSTKTLYAVACTLENNTLVYRLHAVDITTGTPRAGSGVVISGSYGALTFDARNAWQRVSLVLSGNNVVFGFGALEHESTANPYVGWVMAYDKTALTQTGIYATVTTGNGGGGVWQSGRPPAVDSSGHVYVFTGNAYGGGYDGVANFSESVLKLDPANGLKLVDWFTPSNWANMDMSDLDLSSSGPLLVTSTSLLVGGGKTGIIYVLNTANLGQYTANDSGALQKIQTSKLRGGPVYWHRATALGALLYEWGANGTLNAYRFNGARFASTPTAQGTVTNQIQPGGILALSANGETAGTGVLWATVVTSGNVFGNPPVPGELYAFDASNVANELWNSNMNAARDSFGNFAKYVPPLIAHGKVYVATWSNQVAVYGLTATTLTGISPSSGPTAGGTPVAISGGNFAAGATVTFGGAAAISVKVVSATKITANTPSNAPGPVTVMVTNPDGQTATLTTGYTYSSPP